MALNRKQTALGSVLGLSLLCVVAYVTLREQPETKRIIAPSWARAGFTGSMVPTFQGGERYLIEPAPFQAIREGDIIVVWWEARSLNVVHRAIDIKRDDKGQTVAIVTKGDANQVRDPYLCTEENYVGRAVWPPNRADLSNGVLVPSF